MKTLFILMVSPLKLPRSMTMQFFRTIALAALGVATCSLATAEAHKAHRALTVYEKACGKQPNAKELASCAAQLKDCEAGLIEQKWPAKEAGTTPLEACRQQIFEGDDGGAKPPALTGPKPERSI